MVLHVIARGLRQYDRGPHFAHHRAHAPKLFHRVQHLDIAHYGVVQGRAERLGRRARLGKPLLRDGCLVVLESAAVAVGDIHHVQFIAGLAQPQQGAGHHDLDIVGVRAYPQRHGLGHGLFSLVRFHVPANYGCVGPGVQEAARLRPPRAFSNAGVTLS